MTPFFNLFGGDRESLEAEKFCFFDTPPLIDNELELVVPEYRWIDDVLAACQHPLTRGLDAEHASTTRRQLLDFLRFAPKGHEPADLRRDHAPSYHFWMRLHGHNEPPPVMMAGVISLRVGQSEDIEQYFGHIGYNVYPPARGRHYAERACRLIFPLARRHGLNPLWVTADPANIASRRTCERLGGILVDIVDVPGDHPLYARGQRRKCRYQIDL